MSDESIFAHKNELSVLNTDSVQNCMYCLVVGVSKAFFKMLLYQRMLYQQGGSRAGLARGI